jgi:preprotein translocase subunit SecA
MNENKVDLTVPHLDDESDCCSEASCCPTQKPITRVVPKMCRNDPCFCKSGRKYKKCCGK